MAKLSIAQCVIEHYYAPYDWKRAGQPYSDPNAFGMCVYPPDDRAGRVQYNPKKAEAYRSVEKKPRRRLF